MVRIDLGPVDADAIGEILNISLGAFCNCQNQQCLLMRELIRPGSTVKAESNSALKIWDK